MKDFQEQFLREVLIFSDDEIKNIADQKRTRFIAIALDATVDTVENLVKILDESPALFASDSELKTRYVKWVEKIQSTRLSGSVASMPSVLSTEEHKYEETRAISLTEDRRQSFEKVSENSGKLVSTRSIDYRALKLAPQADEPSLAPVTDEGLISKAAELTKLLIDKTSWDDECLRSLKELGACFRSLSWDIHKKVLTRNRYGYFDRADGKKIRPQGIDFETLAKLEELLAAEIIVALYREKFVQVQLDLALLYTKLDFIIKKQDIPNTEEHKRRTLFDQITNFMVDLSVSALLVKRFDCLKSTIESGGLIIVGEELKRKILYYAQMFEFAKIGEDCKRLCDSPAVLSIHKDNYEKIRALKKFRDDIKQITQKPWRAKKAEEIRSALDQFTKSVDDLIKLFNEIYCSLKAQAYNTEHFNMVIFISKINEYYSGQLGAATKPYVKGEKVVVANKSPKVINVESDFAGCFIALVPEIKLIKDGSKAIDGCAKDRKFNGLKAQYIKLQKKYQEAFPLSGNAPDFDSLLGLAMPDFARLITCHQKNAHTRLEAVAAPAPSKKKLTEEEYTAKQAKLLDNIFHTLEAEIGFQKELLKLEQSEIVIKALAISQAVIGSGTALINPTENKLAMEDFLKICPHKSDWFKCLQEIELLRNKAIMHEEKSFEMESVITKSLQLTVPYQESIEAARFIRDFENKFLKEFGTGVYAMPPIIHLYKDKVYNIISYLYKVSYFYGVIGNNQRAIEEFEKLLPIAREVGPDHTAANINANLSELYFLIGNIDKSIEHKEQLVSILKETLGDKKNQHLADCLFQLASLYKHIGREIEANRTSDLAKGYNICVLALKAHELEFSVIKNEKQLKSLFTEILNSLSSVTSAGDLTQYVLRLNSYVKDHVEQGHYYFCKDLMRSFIAIFDDREGIIRELLQGRIVILKALILNTAADIEYSIGNYEEALKFNLQALSELDRLDCNNPYRVNILTAIASSQVGLEHFAQCEETLEKLNLALDLHYGAEKVHQRDYLNMQLIKAQIATKQYKDTKFKSEKERTTKYNEILSYLNQIESGAAKSADENEFRVAALMLKIEIMLERGNHELAYQAFLCLAQCYQDHGKARSSQEERLSALCQKLLDYYNDQYLSSPHVNILIRLEVIIEFFIKHVLAFVKSDTDKFNTYFTLANVYLDGNKLEFALKTFSKAEEFIESLGITKVTKVEFYSKYAEAADRMIGNSTSHGIRGALIDQIKLLTSKALELGPRASSEARAAGEESIVGMGLYDLVKARTILEKHTKPQVRPQADRFVERFVPPAAASFRLGEIERKIRTEYIKLKSGKRLDLKSVSKEDLDLFCREKMAGIEVRTLKLPKTGSAMMLNEKVISFLRELSTSRESSLAFK